MLDMITMISSDPNEVARRCREEERLVPLVKTSLLLLLLGAGSFGLVLGSARDMTQALATMTKLPLVWIVTLAVAAPGFYATAAVLGQPLRLRALLALTLAATARASLVLFALLPVVWLFSQMAGGRLFEASPVLAPQQYHQLTLLAASIFAVSGLAALGVLLRGFAKSTSTWPIVGLFTLGFFLVAGQTAWSLRPFVGRPAQTDVPAFRRPEGTFLRALSVGFDSARGHYHDSCADCY